MTLKLPHSLLAEMVEHAFNDLPNECCGIIEGKDGVGQRIFRTRNAEASPFRYNIHPLDLKNALEAIEEDDAQVLVIYHSHVASEAYPSPTDVRLSQWPGTDPPTDLFPGTYYVLVSLKDHDAPSVRAYQIHNAEVTEEDIEAF